MTVSAEHLWIILGMAVVTYLTRIVGYFGIGHRKISPRLNNVLEAVPGAVLIAVIAPAILNQGLAGAVAGAITILAAWRLPLLAVVAIAVITAAIARAYLA